MKTVNLIIIAIFSLLVSCESTEKFRPVDYVDPQIGSVHGRWFFYTPAARPFGMAKLAPHTNAWGSMGSWLPCGYDDRHRSIEGFGHFHEFQVGGLVFMPVTGEIKTVPGTLDNPDAGYRSRFSRDTEISKPGYYSVVLSDYDIKAEITSTKRVGYHRYTYPETESAALIIDIGHKQGESSDVTEAFIEKVSDTELEGYIETNPEYIKFCDAGNRVKMYFYIKLDREPDSWGIFEGDTVIAGIDKTRAVANGMFVRFNDSGGEQVLIRSGLSYTSVENARLNYESEARTKSFDQVVDDSQNAWNNMLSVIMVEGGNNEDKIKFYTGLYHALLGRGLASDVNGMYPRNDGSAGRVPLDDNGEPLYNHYNTDGIWGGFWNLGQLWALAYPWYLSEYMQSNLDFSDETGWLHDGVAAGAYANGVQTNYNGLMLAAAYNCGIRDFDIEKAYAAALKNETEYSGRDFGSGKYDLHYFVNNGYIPSYDTTLSNGWVFNFGASHTLEFCFSSFAVAEFAKALGRVDDYEKLMSQAIAYKRIFDPETKFVRPRNEDGSFIDNFDPMEPWRGFQEGNAFQYTWYVPHDPAGIIELVGEDLFNERLEKMFTDARKSVFGGGEEIDSFSGLEKLYNHGNQPCLHNAWLFNYSGKPWLTQKWVRLICDEFYGTEPLHGYGYGQDEDQGQLGAWYVMASLGLFDVSGHAFSEPVYQIGSPLFDRVTIKLDPEYYPGKELVITTENNVPGNKYVKEIQFNGQKLDKYWIKRAELLNGGILKIRLVSEPSKDDRRLNLPPSMSTKTGRE
ncbi:MAG: GH92 family glycosyl hydrolase [Bacteroidales bacterium]|nr:GH92 family glycosyl hydrolase [Bacteroidales bacterium]